MTDVGQPCRWCTKIRPDHDEDCPVRALAEGLAKTFGSSPGAVVGFHIGTFEGPDPEDPNPDPG